MIQDAEPVNLDVVEAVVAAARRRPVPPLPDTKVSLDTFFLLEKLTGPSISSWIKQLLLRRKMRGETRTDKFAAPACCTRPMSR